METVEESKTGWVYVLSNPSFPGRVKIGFTDRDVPSRTRELSNSTGVPTPFVWEYGVRVEHARGVEHSAHRALHDVRVHKGREFFECTVAVAVSAVQGAMRNRPALKVFDRAHLAAKAAAIAEQFSLLSQWKTTADEELKQRRQALEAQCTSARFLPRLVLWSAVCALPIATAFEGKRVPLVLVSSAFFGAIVALIHTRHKDSDAKVSINFDAKLNAIEETERAVRLAHDAASQRLKRGESFDQFRGGLPEVLVAKAPISAPAPAPKAPPPSDEQAKPSPVVSPAIWLPEARPAWARPNPLTRAGHDFLRPFFVNVLAILLALGAYWFWATRIKAPAATSPQALAPARQHAAPTLPPSQEAIATTTPSAPLPNRAMPAAIQPAPNIRDLPKATSTPPPKPRIERLQSQSKQPSRERFDYSKCVYKAVMSDADYRACGLNPPSTN